MKTWRKYNDNQGHVVPVIVSRDGIPDETAWTTASELALAVSLTFPVIFTAAPSVTRVFVKKVLPDCGVLIETSGTGFDGYLRQYFPPSYVLAADRRWAELINQYDHDARWKRLM